MKKSKKKTIAITFTIFALSMCVSLAVVLLFFWGDIGADLQSIDDTNTLQRKMAVGTVSSPNFREMMPYRLFIPEMYSEEKQYPLVVWLHGAGGRGNDNIRQLDFAVGAFVSEEVQRYQPSLVLAPQCPENHQWVEMADTGPPYVNYDLDSVQESIWFKLLSEAIEQLEAQYSIDKRRIYVSGFSMGAAGVWDVIERHPQLFAAAMPLSGKGDPSKTSRIAHLPIWAFHGKFDTIAPITNIREFAAAFRGVNRQFKITELWRKHDIVKHVFKDLEPFRWLFSQSQKGVVSI